MVTINQSPNKSPFSTIHDSNFLSIFSKIEKVILLRIIYVIILFLSSTFNLYIIPSAEKMRISWERTGGFAGISKHKSLDTAFLTTEENQQLLTLLEAVDFFNLPTHITTESIYPDTFEYMLTVEDEGKQHSVIIAETALTGNLRALIEWLNRAMSQK